MGWTGWRAVAECQYFVVVAAAPRTRQLTVPHYKDRLGSWREELTASISRLHRLDNRNS